MKKIVGEPRPCFYDMSQWRDGECRASKAMCWDARQSFPSGHTSMAFGSFLFLSMYVHGRLSSQRIVLLPRLPMLSLALVWAPPLVALWVGCTRVVDHRHDTADVIGGAVVGAGGAVLAYSAYFHAPCSPRAGKRRDSTESNAADMRPLVSMSMDDQA